MYMQHFDSVTSNRSSSLSEYLEALESNSAPLEQLNSIPFYPNECEGHRARDRRQTLTELMSSLLGRTPHIERSSRLNVHAPVFVPRSLPRPNPPGPCPKCEGLHARDKPHANLMACVLGLDSRFDRPSRLNVHAPVFVPRSPPKPNPPTLHPNRLQRLHARKRRGVEALLLVIDPSFRFARPVLSPPLNVHAPVFVPRFPPRPDPSAPPSSDLRTARTKIPSPGLFLVSDPPPGYPRHTSYHPINESGITPLPLPPVHILPVRTGQSPFLTQISVEEVGRDHVIYPDGKPEFWAEVHQRVLSEFVPANHTLSGVHDLQIIRWTHPPATPDDTNVTPPSSPSTISTPPSTTILQTPILTSPAPFPANVDSVVPLSRRLTLSSAAHPGYGSDVVRRELARHWPSVGIVASAISTQVYNRVVTG